jgi:glycosyltransferase involved in cell wall biosynthesis
MTKKKNILFISYDGMTDPLGQSQVIPYLAGLTNYGYQFTILSCEKPERFEIYKEHIEKILKPYSIKWAPIKYHKRPPVLSSVYDVMMLKRKAKHLHRSENFDMVHTRPGVPALIGLWMKKKWGVKFLNDIREFYADSRSEGGIWNINNIFYKIIYNYFKRKEDEEVQMSDGMVCLTHAAEKIIKKWPRYKKEITLEVIPCSVDMDFFDPQKITVREKEILRRELNLKESDFIISYLGSIGGWYLTDEMMKFCKNISDEVTNAKFLFISPHQHDIIYDKATQFGLENEKVIVKNAQRHEVPLLLSLSKYSVFFIKSCYSKQSSSPTKHGEIMAMGIPVITNSGVGDVAEIIEKCNSGFVLKKLDNENFIQYSKIIATANFDTQKIRQGASEFYSLKNAVENYLAVYRDILEKTPVPSTTNQ